MGEQYPATEDETVDILLVRHGHTADYTEDGGLTEHGVEQSLTWGRQLAAGVPADERVMLLTGPARRARETAENVRSGLAEGSCVVAAPRAVAGFDNFRVRTPSGPQEITEAFPGYRQAAARVDGGPRPLWIREIDVFWDEQVRGEDPITLWMRVPLLTFEPPVAVVHRFLAAITDLVQEASSRTLYVCCTHSGPMRALAAWALGRDLGEPQNTEVVLARVRRDLSAGWITYRGTTQAFGPASPLDRMPGWDPAGPEGRRQP